MSAAAKRYRPPGVRESTIEKYLVAQCKRRGWLAPKLDVRSHRGWPDRIVVAGKRAVMVEVKSPTGRVTPIQKHWHEQIQLAGSDVVVVKTKDEIDELLNLIEKGHHF